MVVARGGVGGGWVKEAKEIRGTLMVMSTK